MSTGYAIAEEVSPIGHQQQQKVKKVGFIKRWLLNQVKSAVQQEKEEQEMNHIRVPRAIGIDSARTIDSEKGIRFQVYKASGGFIIETGTFDRRTDRHHTSLHIITDDKDLGNELGKIITMESLKT